MMWIEMRSPSDSPEKTGNRIEYNTEWEKDTDKTSKRDTLFFSYDVLSCIQLIIRMGRVCMWWWQVTSDCGCCYIIPDETRIKSTRTTKYGNSRWTWDEKIIHKGFQTIQPNHLMREKYEQVLNWRGWSRARGFCSLVTEPGITSIKVTLSLQCLLNFISLLLLLFISKKFKWPFKLGVESVAQGLTN